MKLACIAALGLAFATGAYADPGNLDMTAFFTGRTHADNVLKVAFKHSVPLVVDSIGGKGDKGDFVLIDTVHEGDKPVRTRKWIIRQVGPGHYSGSLSDAVGPVDVTVNGKTALVQYMMSGGLKVQQRMDLLPDGKTLANHVSVTKFGMKFGSVEGKIRRLD